MSDNTEDDIIRSEKLNYPHCNYSKSISQSCSYSTSQTQSSAGDIDSKFICETITSISRMCPNQRPVIIYSKKDQHTGELEGNNLFGGQGSTELNDRLSEILKSGFDKPFDLDKFMDMHLRGEENRSDELEERPDGRTFEFKFGSKPWFGNGDRDQKEPKGGIFKWFPWSSSSSRSSGVNEVSTTQNPPKKPQGRITGPEEDI